MSDLTLDDLVSSVEAAQLRAGIIEISLPMIPPSGNHYKKPRVVNGHLSWYLTKEAVSFKEAVAAMARGRSISPDTALERAKVAYRITVTVTLGPKQRQDADNGLKVSLDALKDCGAIHSDARVSTVTGHVIWDQRKFGPNTTIRAQRVED